ncbi:MAG: exosortase/archaeosortase family protein [Planctomycetes bacterium]|nr:exosortase/archaeosortase family protein [Planctomycetota bacterium]
MTVAQKTPTLGHGAGGAAASSLALLLALVWSYWPTIASRWKDWQLDANYSVGQIVPPLAAWLLWSSRERWLRAEIRPCLWGAALMLLGQAVRGAGVLFLYESLERYSLIVTLAGLVLLVGGWVFFRRVGAVVVFLALMIPLPGRVHNLIAGPLQALAANASVATLELLGVDVLRSGYALTLNGAKTVAIAEGCSGLRMLMAFVVVSAAMALLIERPLWQRVTVLLSSLPIAIVCNVLRLAATALLCMWTSSRTAEVFFHDFAGVSMMPLAIGLLVAELWLLKRLEIPEPAKVEAATT